MKAIEKFGKLLAPLIVAREIRRQNEPRLCPDGKKEEIDEFVKWLSEVEVGPDQDRGAFETKANGESGVVSEKTERKIADSQ